MNKSGKWGKCRWELFDWGYLAIEEGLAGSTFKAEDMPWYDVRENITSVKFEGPIQFEEGASMAHLFDGCINLQRIDFRNLNTNRVVSMDSLFEDCENLVYINFNELDTRYTKSMVATFMNCIRLSSVDMSGMSTPNLEDIGFMFAGCESLSELNMSGIDTSNIKNSAHIFDNCDKLPPHIISLAEKSAERERENNEERISAENYNDDFASGSLVKVDSEVGRRLAWAGAPIFLGPVELIPPIVYGETLQLRPPQIDRNNGQELELSVEISPDGITQWTQFNPAAILPASGNGCYIRYRATNEFGSSVTPGVRIIIRKADYDMSNVRWKGIENVVYDGKPKTVSLVGLPNGIKAVYANNVETEAGEYFATAQLLYDDVNYNTPAPIEDLQWRIIKADYNMKNAKWVYDKPFAYDGTEKQIYLEGLPEGVTPIYRDNVEIKVGMYYATVYFAYDERNYNRPENVNPCTWEIRKAYIEMAGVKWTDVSNFVFDGKVHEVRLENLPAGVSAHYIDNRAVDAGAYKAIARFELNDSVNYYVPDKLVYDWQIQPSDPDMTLVVWDYHKPFSYDGGMKTVALINLPKGVTVVYTGNKAVDTGTYEARAHFTVYDDNNFSTPDDMILQWEIEKSDYNMTDVAWNYSSPFVFDGTDKRVELINLPHGISAEYVSAVAINVGKYTASAILRYDDKNYNKPSVEGCAWEIIKANLDVRNVYWAFSDQLMYDGNEHMIELHGLPESLLPEYSNNTAVDAGEYYATAKLSTSDQNNYNPPEIMGCSWRIKKANFDMSDVMWNSDGRFTYDGTSKKVTLTNVPDGLEVIYEENEYINAGSYRARARFEVYDKKNYEAPEDMFFFWEINKREFISGDIVWDYTDPFVYDGDVHEVHVINLPEGIIPIYNHNRAISAGVYSAHVEFELTDSDNYIVPSGADLRWEILKADYNMLPVKWEYSSPLLFDGGSQEVMLTGLPEGVYATYLDNIATHAGDYYATAVLHYDEANYNKPAVQELRWRIVKGQYNLSALRWNYSGSFVYDGQIKTVELDGFTSDVNIRYQMNKAVDAGIYEAKAFITLKDNQDYEQPEVMTLTWEIKKASFDMTNVKWSYERPFEYTGNACVVTLYNLPEGVWAEYDKNVGINAGMYEASAEFKINNSENYIVPSKKTCQWEIVKADLDMSRAHWEYRQSLPYTGKEQTVELVGIPTGVKVTYEGNKATDAGLYEASAHFHINDEWNINTPSVPNLRWEIVKSEYDMSRVEWNYKSPLVYSGEEQSIELVNLPEGLSAHYIGNTGKDAGSYVAKVKLISHNPANYITPTVDDCMWRIKKADYDMSEVHWNYDSDTFYYDGNPKTVTLEGLPFGVTALYSGNTQTKAGNYTAMVYFTIDNPYNCNVPKIENLEWKINKGIFDMTTAYWNFNDGFVFDGREKRVRINNLPRGITATYTGNSGVNAGSYVASALLHYDVDNYEQPYFDELKWNIAKAVPDVSRARWDYLDNFKYDGKVKSISLVGLPQGLTAKYKNNSFVEAGNYVAEVEIIPDDRLNYREAYVKPCDWTIKKADYNMSSMKWVGGDTFVYDGFEHKVELTGLPEGVRVEYKNNVATTVGEYTAEAQLFFDSQNYNTITVNPYHYAITKARYDMTSVAWNYRYPYVYDGKPHSVELAGLPYGIKPIYENNSFVNAGEYESSVSFMYDSLNYEEPTMHGVKWVINKANLDLSGVHWDVNTIKVYNGQEQAMRLVSVNKSFTLFERLRGAKDEIQVVGLPDNAYVEYEGDVQVDSGVYLSKAIIIPTDEENYEFPKPLECRWEIKKAYPNMNRVRWSYERPLSYTGMEHTIQIEGLPDGVKVDRYEGNKALEVGTYTARVEFLVEENGNYHQPEGMTIRWKIDRKAVDMSAVHWDYTEPFEYDGMPKTVQLVYVPKEVNVSYMNNTKTNPGSFVAKAILEYDKSCYRVAEIEDCKWQILGEKTI